MKIPCYLEINIHLLSCPKGWIHPSLCFLIFFYILYVLDLIALHCILCQYRFGLSRLCYRCRVFSAHPDACWINYGSTESKGPTKAVRFNEVQTLSSGLEFSIPSQSSVPFVVRFTHASCPATRPCSVLKPLNTVVYRPSMRSFTISSNNQVAFGRIWKNFFGGGIRGCIFC